MIDGALEQFGVSQVYLAGHSRGTATSGTYMASNAAKVAKYVSLDGTGCAGAPVPCIAPAQANQPGERHVEVSTSEASFVKMYQHFLGEAPKVTKIVGAPGPVSVSGRIVNFPENTGRLGTLRFFEVDSART